MWIILAILLICYLVGCMLYIWYNREGKCASRWNCGERGVDVENPSSGSTHSDTTTSGQRRPTAPIPTTQGQCNFNHNHPLDLNLSCLYYDEINHRDSNLPIQIQQSALTAHREQQLRQIKQEINELSRRLGIGQVYRDRQLYIGLESSYSACNYNYVDVPVVGNRCLTVRETFVQPSSSTSNSMSSRSSRSSSRRSCRTPGSGSQVSGGVRRMINNEGSPQMTSPSSSTSLLEMSFNDNNFNVTEQTEGNAIFSERQRRLRRIRMEIQDLTLQLTSLSEDRSISENNAGGCSISSLDLEGLVFGDQDSGDEEQGLSGSYSCRLDEDDELPSYDDSIVVDMLEESPPPSYAQCTTSTNFISSDLDNFYSTFTSSIHEKKTKEDAS